MKKIYIIILLSALSISARAQEGWRFGAYFDPVVGWGSANGSIKSDGSKLGFSFTLNGENYFKERYAFTLGASFTSLGGKINNISPDRINFRSTNDISLDPGQTAKIRASYLGIPIGLKFKTPDFGMLGVYLSLSLVPSIKLSGKAIIDGNSQKITKDFNFMTCSTQIGLGTMYSTGDNTYITAGLLFNYYFIDALRGSNLNFNPMNLGLRLGYLF